jgi:hypothetical protein
MLSLLKRLAAPGVAVAILAAAPVGQVKAETIVPALVSQTSLGGGLYSYVYDITLSPNGVLNNGSGGTAPSFVTIYDIAGLQGTPTYAAVVAGATFNVTTPALGVTPNGISPVLPLPVTDSAGILNVTLAYSGANGLGGGIDIFSPTFDKILGTLTVVSNAGLTTIGQYSQQDTAIGGLGREPSLGPVMVPTAAPLPATASMGFGLLGGLGCLMGANAVRRRRMA